MSEKEIISIDLSSDSEPEESQSVAKVSKEAAPASISPPQRVIQPFKKDLRRDDTVEGKAKRAERTLKMLTLQDQFMGHFDPENSNREKRKFLKKFQSESAKTGHDEYGLIVGSNMDLCDCLSEECPGCFFPCPSCRSCKCGVECRNNRKLIIESVENEADHTITRNPWVLRNPNLSK